MAGLLAAAGCSSDPPRAPSATSPPVASVPAATVTEPPATATVAAAPTVVVPTTPAPPSTDAPSTEQPSTEPSAQPSTTLVALAPDQQVETMDEIRSLLTSAPGGATPDPDAPSIDASIATALSHLTDGSLSIDDFFWAAGDFVPDGVVIDPYLACPLSIGDVCRATAAGYLAYATETCAGLPMVVSLAQGPLGPAGAGTCVWRPTEADLADVEALVGEALANVVPAQTAGEISPSIETRRAAQASAEFTAEHPFENPTTANIDGAEAVRAALAPLYDHGFECARTWYVDPIDDDERAQAVDDIAAGVRSRIGGPVGRTADSRIGIGTAIGSGRLFATWCVAGVA